MTPSNPQSVQPNAVQPVRATTHTFAASMQGMRTVAIALLVDRALSA
jgi:hypothetical protein